jgi:hypothetical protein
MHNLSWIGLAVGKAWKGSPVQLRITVDFSGLLPAFPEICRKGKALVKVHVSVHRRA